MELIHDRSGLGKGFIASLFIHIVFLLIFAGFFISPSKNRLPDTKKMMVEIFERSFEDKPKPVGILDKKVKSPPKIGERAKKIYKREEIFKERVEPPTVDALVPHPTADEVVIPDDKALSEKVLPHVSDLIPSYESIASQNLAEGLSDKTVASDEVSLNTRDLKYVSYFSKLKRKIEMVWRYPQAARLAGLYGDGVMRMSLNGDGTLREISLYKSSGISVLDNEAINAIKRAAPYYPVPEHMGDSLKILVPFKYYIEN